MPRVSNRNKAADAGSGSKKKDEKSSESEMTFPAPAPEWLSHSVVFNNIVHFAGQHADDISQDIKGQMRQICEKLDKWLEESNTDRTKITRADIFLKDKSMFPDLMEVWKDWIDTNFPPSCNPMIVADFPREGVLAEVAIIAAISNDYDAVGEGEGGEQISA